MMAKKFNEYSFLILLLEKIEDGENNSFEASDIIQDITDEELKSIIKKCKTHNWIEIPCLASDCGFILTEQGKGVAVSKRKEYDENIGKKINKFIGDYKNIFYIIGFCATLAVAYIKIKG